MKGTIFLEMTRTLNLVGSVGLENRIFAIVVGDEELMFLNPVGLAKRDPQNVLRLSPEVLRDINHKSQLPFEKQVEDYHSGVIKQVTWKEAMELGMDVSILDPVVLLRIKDLCERYEVSR